ncbi:MAG TPA: hypothetical protein VFP72_15655, partial [Kineosporiaceae bacterium]|nr:hypothetical protein [Kineosporiaceae bacterium]
LGPLSGPAHDRNVAAQIAAAITTQAPSVDGRYHKSGAAATTALARAFIDQTLHAAQAAHPGLIPPDQLTRLQDAHRTTWEKLTTLAGHRAARPQDAHRATLAKLTTLAASPTVRPPVNDWSSLITEFVNQVNATDAEGHVWSQLRNQLHGNQLRAADRTPAPIRQVTVGRDDPDPTTSPSAGPQARDTGASPITDHSHTRDQLDPTGTGLDATWWAFDATWWTDALDSSPQEPTPLPGDALPPDPITAAPQFTSEEIAWLTRLLHTSQQPQTPAPDTGTPPWDHTPTAFDTAAPIDTDAYTLGTDTFPTTASPADALVNDGDPAGPLPPPPEPTLEPLALQPISDPAHTGTRHPSRESTAEPVDRSGAGPQIWPHLHDLLAEPAAPAHDGPSVTSHPPRISQALRAAANQRFGQAGIGFTDTARRSFFRYWPVKPAAPGGTSSPASVDWAGKWRDTPELAAVLPELLTLATLPQRPGKAPGRAGPTTDPYHAARQTWGQTVLAAAWHHAGLTDPTQPGEHAPPDPAHTPARTAQRAVEILAPRGAAGQRHYPQGVAVTSALAQAFLDQTLHAAETAAGLTSHQVIAVRTVHEAARKGVASLGYKSSPNRNSPARWADLVTRFVTDITTSAGPQIWTALQNWLRHAQPALQPAPQKPAQRNALPDPAEARREHPDPESWPITEVERQRVLKVLGSAGKGVYSAGGARLSRYRHQAGNGTPGSIAWDGMVALPAWRHSPHLSDTLPTALALSVLTWKAPGEPDPFAETRQEWGGHVVHALWQHVEATTIETTTVDATTEDPGPLPGPAHDRTVAARVATQVAAAITTQAPTINGAYHKSGAAATSALTRAFIDQTLHAAHTAGPDLIPPDHLTRLQDAHRAAWAKLTTLADPRAPQRPVNDWSTLITEFVNQVNTTDNGGHLWSQLRHQFQGNQLPAADPTQHPPRRRTAVRPQELAAAEHQEALRILTQSPLEPPARLHAENMLTRWWVADSVPAQREDPATAPAGYTWPHAWRQGPGSAALASLMALAVLPWPSPHTTDGPGLTETRDRLQKDLLQLLWNSAEDTAPAPTHRSADTATRMAAAIAAAQLPPFGASYNSGASYDEAGVHTTAALTLALLDQTLHAVQAAEPGLTPTVQQAHRAAWEAAMALLDPTHLRRTSPAAWEAVSRYFIARIINQAGPHIWTYLEDHLHGRPPRPAPTHQNSPRPDELNDPDELDDDWLLQALHDPDHPSPTTTPAHPPTTTPLDQAPWLHAMLSNQHHTNSPTPPPAGSPSPDTNTPTPENQPRPKRPRRQTQIRQ